MAEQDYQVQDPQGNIRVIRGPAGASDAEVIAKAQELFSSTPGGAATGNPNIQRQGEQARRYGGSELAEMGAKIGGATAIGGALGAVSKEILGGAGNVIGALPYPWARTAGNFLTGASRAIGAAGRAAPTAAGAISGGVGETAGQMADIAFPDSVVIPEVTRFVAGGIGPETAKIVPWALRKIGHPSATAAEVIDFIARAVGKKDGLSDAQRAYVAQEVAALQGTGGQSDLIGVGNRMGAQADALTQTAEQRTRAALMEANNVGKPTPAAEREFADIGGELRDVITKRNQKMIDDRRAEFKATEASRDGVVQQKEAAGQFVNVTPEFKALVANLKGELKPGVHSESVQANLRRILDDLESGAEPGVKSATLGERGFEITQGEGKAGKLSFQALDEIRRKLGDAYRGKKAEGYDAIGEVMAKRLYEKVSDIQKQYAGPAQAKLLDDYASKTEGLQVFRSKSGKRATALDLYDDSQFATDASTLPKSYFKTRASVEALKELTGDAGLAARAAAEFTNKELAGKTGPEARAWLGKNSDWLSHPDMSTVRKMASDYTTKLEAAEVSGRNAKAFADQAAKDVSLLTRDALPAQRAVDLIKSGSDELWTKAGPAIAQSPQAKQEVMKAARVVLADQATAKGTITFYERNLRPFLERAAITNADELDFIAQKLTNIRDMKLPEQEKLGRMKRIILQSLAGMSASVASRGGVNAYQWSREKVVPE